MTRMDLIPQALVDAAMPLWTPEVSQRVFKAELWTKAMEYIHQTPAMQTDEQQDAPKWQKIKAKASDLDPTEKDAFIKLSNAHLPMSDVDVWAERFVDETMIPRFIAHGWDLSGVERLYEDGPSLGETQVTPSHACVTCMS